MEPPQRGGLSPLPFQIDVLADFRTAPRWDWGERDVVCRYRPPAQPGIAANGPWQLRYGVGSGLWSAVGVPSFLPAAPCQRVDLDRSRIEGDAGRRRKGGKGLNQRVSPFPSK